MADYSFLLGAKPIQQPSPLDLAQQGLSLSQMMDSATMRQMAMQKAKQEQQAQEAINRALPAVMGANWSPESIQAAVQQNPQAAGTILDMLDKKRKAEADNANTNAQAAERTSIANKNRATPLSNIAFGLANDPQLTPEKIGMFQKLVADNKAESLLPAVPFAAWNDPEKARQVLKMAGNAFFDAEKQASQAETGRHNVVGETQQGANIQSEIERRLAQTANDKGHLGIAGAQLGLARDRLKYEKQGAKWDSTSGQFVTPPAAPGDTGNAVTPTGYVKPPKNAPEGYSTQVAGIENLSSAMTDYKQKLKTWSNGSLASPDKRASMGTAYTDMLMQAKEAYRLGVLNGPDYQLLTSVLTDPVSLRGSLVSTKAMEEQIDQMVSKMEQRKTNLAKVYKQPLPAGTESAPTAPGIEFLLNKYK